MDTGLKGKSVIVTGGGSNIGRGIVLAFAREGARIAIVDLDEPQSQKVAARAKELGAEAALAVKTDVTSKSDIQRMVDTVLRQYGGIDVLVNNVGIWNTTPFVEEPDEIVDRQININLKATINCCKAVLPHMIKARGGRIVSIGSEAGRAGDAQRAVYSATKGAVISLTRALAREMGQHDITVNCVCPHGVTPDDFAEELGEGSGLYQYAKQRAAAPPDAAAETAAMKAMLESHAIRRMGKPADIAAAVVFLASEPAGYITGQTLNVNGGVTMD